MDASPIRTRRRPAVRALAPLIVLSLLVGGGAAGCTSSSHETATTPPTGVGGSTAAPVPTGERSIIAAAQVPLGAMTMPTSDEVSAAWAARPGYVKALPAEWQGAYAFALARPDVLQWLPCYCGCSGAGHRSNLDCFFDRREVKGTFQYQEHASYCDICVRTANLAQQLLRDGKTISEIRAAVDATFGGGAAPGTDTALPPA